MEVSEKIKSNQNGKRKRANPPRKALLAFKFCVFETVIFSCHVTSFTVADRHTTTSNHDHDHDHDSIKQRRQLSNFATKYAVVIDAGSTGTRCFIYGYDNHVASSKGHTTPPKINTIASMKIQQGISEYINDTAAIPK